MLLSCMLREEDLRALALYRTATLTGIAAYSSRDVRPGFLFVAIKGYKLDGHRFCGRNLFPWSKRGGCSGSAVCSSGKGLAVVDDSRFALSHPGI